jgi:hypothetical protein
MKSLAHPEWPYTGTPWEWRGFAKAASRTGVVYEGDDRKYHGAEAVRRYLRDIEAVYQKQNFGPELK